MKAALVDVKADMDDLRTRLDKSTERWTIFHGEEASMVDDSASCSLNDHS